jgi:hypothetical protein
MEAPRRDLVRARVSSDIAELNILNLVYPWIPNATQIRPTPDQLVAKHASTAELNQAWRSMRDYILHSVFERPVCLDTDNKLCAAGSEDTTPTLSIRFCPNPYPYNTQEGGLHYVLWFNCHDEPNLNVNKIVAKELRTLLGHENFDFAWYCNPKMSLPDFYHVQVFWVLLTN